MDADYLKKNVKDALAEALTAMAVKIPEDEIEYVGKYLLKYVERKKIEKEGKTALEEVETNLAKYLEEVEVTNRAMEEKALEASMFKTRYQRFLDALQFEYKSKQDAMDGLTDFIETSLDIPAAYIATKKVAGENEVLNYVSAGPSQTKMKGKKLPKPAADEEDAPPRLGVSFEAFKLPEIPEGEEEPAEDEDGNPLPPKAPPKAQPLVIENAMRDKRCKFFGIPRLGSFAAIPFSYQSLMHEEGVVLGEPPAVEEGQEPIPADYGFAKKESQFLVCIDTIGKYRALKPAEIARIVDLGENMVKLFETLETEQGNTHIAFLKSDAFKAVQEAAPAEFAAKFAEPEAAVVARVGEEVAAEAAARAAAADPEGEPPVESETLKPFKEAHAVLTEVWNAGVGGDATVSSALSGLQGYTLPLPAPALNCLYAVACLVGCAAAEMQNVCGDPDWGVIQQSCLAGLAGKIAAYDPAAPLEAATTTEAHKLASIKAFAEATGILDAGAYPPTMAICANALLPWLQKALAAREAAIAYHTEIGTALE
mmetsp:Transcript_31870/g.53765  ORF Transcript_31870/g.53765 Transcript_31870/m.53765 type:complete len:539 (+) Transcript_31870:117-1733(+)